ncbi:unnamed protein product [Mytilus coruscus]|uniref:Uncharacterized protein n=1 Tax=Mytilus coruscus TaxID=42192 RepID=A0A6J8BFT3_MYTCO|nr:unnamed protein product [Mytilus coruscus]
MPKRQRYNWWQRWDTTLNIESIVCISKFKVVVKMNMDDSNVVTFGPNTGKRDEVDETLSNEVIASSSEKNLTAERMVSDAKVEMKFMVDKCFFLDFSKRMDSMLAKFDHHLTNKITPILGRGDTLALDYFIDAITETDIRLRLREVGPKTIYEAENIAVRLEALRLADRQKGRSVRTADACDADDSKMVSKIKEIKLGIRHLQNDVGAIRKNNTNGQRYNNNNNNGSRQQRGSNNFGNRNFNQNYNSSENYQASSAGVMARPQ